MSPFNNYLINKQQRENSEEVRVRKMNFSSLTESSIDVRKIKRSPRIWVCAGRPSTQCYFHPKCWIWGSANQSCVPNKRAVPNRRAGWKMGPNQINVQGQINMQGGKMLNLDNLVGLIVNSKLLWSNKFWRNTNSYKKFKHIRFLKL